MRRCLLLFFIMFSFSLGCYSMEVETTKAVESINHVIPESEAQTIDNHHIQQENFYPDEIELKGSVIYNEGQKSITVVELGEVTKPAIRLKTPNMIIPVAETKTVSKNQISIPRSAFENAVRLKGEDYCLMPVWSQIKESCGNFSYGTEYFSYIDSAQLDTTMHLYSRYDFKHAALTIGVGTNEKRTGGTYDNIIKVAPELKLSKSFIIRDTVQAYVNNNVKKHKISIIYAPKIKNDPDILRFELGVSNSYNSGGKVNSSIEFTTKIRL